MEIWVLGSVLVTFGLGYVAARRRYRVAKELIKELGEAFTTTYEALADDEITAEEAKKVVEEWKDVYEKAKELV